MYITVQTRVATPSPNKYKKLNLEIDAAQAAGARDGLKKRSIKEIRAITFSRVEIRGKVIFFYNGYQNYQFKIARNRKNRSSSPVSQNGYPVSRMQNPVS